MWCAQTTCSSDETGTEVVDGGAAEAEDGAAVVAAAEDETTAELTTAEVVTTAELGTTAEAVATELDALALVFVTIKTGFVSDGTCEPVAVELSQLPEINSYSSTAQSPPQSSVLSPAHGMPHEPSVYESVDEMELPQ